MIEFDGLISERCSATRRETLLMAQRMENWFGVNDWRNCVQSPTGDTARTEGPGWVGSMN